MPAVKKVAARLNEAHASDGDSWWRGAVIYQIYPRSFACSNGDGVGDLEGITARLDHVASLGVDAIWLSPFFKSPMRDFGYDVSDYCAVDPIFGDLADFDKLLAKAHGLGLKVIIDQVYAHTSDEHSWFAQARADRTNAKADWYVFADPKPDGAPPNNWQSVFGGPAWTFESRRQQYYLHNFLASQPQLNVHNPLVQDALLEAAAFWLARGVDGFRLDAINFAMHDPRLRDNPPAEREGRKLTRSFDYQRHLYNQSHANIPDFLERLRTLTDRHGAVFTVAEVVGSTPLPEMKAFTADGRRLNAAYNFDFLYADDVTPTRVARALGGWTGETGEGWPAWAFSNHDAPRVASRWGGGDLEAAKLYLLLLLCLRGCVFLYQGEELGLPQADIPFEALQDPEAIANWPLTLGRDGARSPMPWLADALNAGFSAGAPWLPIDPRHLALAVDRQERDPNGPLAFARRALDLRRRHSSLRAGSMTILEAGAQTLAFARGAGAQRLLCVFNLSKEPAAYVAPSPAPSAPLLACGLKPEAAISTSALPPRSGLVAPWPDAT